MTPALVGVFGYIAVQFLIGVVVARRIETEDDYLLAGRSLGLRLSSFTIFATWFGAESCVGAAGMIYKNGLSGASSDPFGYTLCLLLMASVFAAPLWKRKLTTVADLFRERYSKQIEQFAVLLMLPTSALWAASQLRAFGQVLSASSDLSLTFTISIAAVIVITYTVLGGFWADAVTDFVQGIALIIGLIALLVAVSGSLTSEVITMSLAPERVRLFGDAPFLETLDAWLVPICGSVVAQELITRVSASRSAAVAQQASFAASGLYLFIGLIPAFIGLVGVALLPTLDDAEQLLPVLAKTHLNGAMYVLFAGALVSAILSTVDSTLLAASSLLCHNILIPCLTLTEAQKVRLNRAGVVAFGIMAYLFALYGGTVYELVKTASTFGSAGIFALLMFGLFTSFGGAKSAAAALVFGAGVWAIAQFAFDLKYAYTLSIFSAVLAYILIAIWEKRASKPNDVLSIR